MMSSYTGLAPKILSVFRIVVGLLFMEHGLQKWLDFPPAQTPREMQLFSMLFFSGTLELIGGALLAIGLFTRPTAFVLSGMMAVAYFIAHAPRGFFPILNGGELAIVYCFAFLYLSAAGGGVWSADRYVRKAG